ncbi:diguanylate cyclase domain-containing protein [Pontibacter sp. JAM-7]|uniref:GGDEF domain-containing protein n=1 Tax=Pontibacter sp. JAM-7 TaxID=3366581 RepID=UPI003AF5B3EA
MTSEIQTTKRQPGIEPAWLFALCGVLFALIAFLLLSKQEQDATANAFATDMAPHAEQFGVRLQQELELAGLLRSVTGATGHEPGNLAAVVPLLVQQHPAAMMLASYTSADSEPVIRWLQPDAISLQTVLLPQLDESVSGQQPETHLIASEQGLLLINSAKRNNGFLVTVSQLQVLLQQSGLMDLPEGVSFDLAMAGSAPLLQSEMPVAEAVAVARYGLSLRDESLELVFYAADSYLVGTLSWMPAMLLLTGLLLAFFYAAYQKRQSVMFRQLRHQRDQLRMQMEASAVTDQITGLANQVRFEQVVFSEIRRAVREFNPLTVMLVKVDGFQAYRDHFGQGQLEQMLSQLGGVLAECISRPGDLLAHIEAETFAMLLPSTNENAPVLAERCCEAVVAAAIPQADAAATAHITVSIGVVTLQPSDRLSYDRLMELAEEQLEKALQQGGGRYQSFIEATDDLELGFGV